MQLLFAIGILKVGQSSNLEAQSKGGLTNDCDFHDVTSENVRLEHFSGLACKASANDESQISNYLNFHGNVVNDR